MRLLEKEIQAIKKWSGPRSSGKVVQVIGMLIESIGPDVSVGEICIIFGKHGNKIPVEVVGFKEERVLLMPLAEMASILLHAEVFPTGEMHRVKVGKGLMGRIIDALGNPIDGKGEIEGEEFFPVISKPPSPLDRRRIQEPFITGIRAIDGFLTLGFGQRVGIFSAPGVGKSTLMGMLARRSQADINVIALIGERGREVREFIEKDLGREGLEKSVVIVSTADQMATLRSKGGNVATAIAEYFRSLGKNVMLMMDSITRYAMALREIALSIGESPAAKGYPPSLFSYLPFLLERAGQGEQGSITGIYTVLEEDENDPISHHMRSYLDGHIVLSKKLSIAHAFPPIDILRSLSRVMDDVISSDHREQASKIRELCQSYQEAEELMEVGAYVQGSNPLVDEAQKKMGAILKFLRQSATTFSSWEKTLEGLRGLNEKI